MIEDVFLFSDEMEKIKIPKDMDDAKALGTVLSKYKDTYYTQVLVAYFATYVLYPWRKHKPLLEKYISSSIECCQNASAFKAIAVIVRCRNSVNLICCRLRFATSDHFQAPKN